MEKLAGDTLEQLAAKWLAGDEKAFEGIYRNSERWVRGYVNQHMPSAEVDDCMQRIYIKLYQNKDKYNQSAGDFRPWMNRLVKNETIDYLRHLNAKTGNQTSMYAGEEEEQIDLLDDNVEHLPEEVIDRQETSKILEEAMSDLTEDQRTCILLHFEQGLKYKEIAEIQGVSEGTVKSRISYGLKNTEKKLRAMEKRGTKLYGIAPIPFFLYLLMGSTSQTVHAAELSSGIWSEVAARTAGQAATKAAAAAGSTGAAGTSAAGTAGTMAAHMVSAKAMIGTVVAAVAVCAAVAGTSAVKLKNNNSELEKARTQIEQLQDDADAAEESGQQLEEERKSVQDENDALQKENEKLQKENEKLETKNKKLEKKNEQLQEQLDDAEDEAQDSDMTGSGADTANTTDASQYSESQNNTTTQANNTNTQTGSSDTNSLDMGDWNVE